MDPMHTQHADTTAGFKAESIYTLGYSRDRMLHALDQLGDEHAWWRPYEQANAPGNIVLHVCGNLRQWIVCGLGGQPDVRDRPNEFATRHELPLSELKAKLCATIEDAIAVIEACDETSLLRSRYVQIDEVTGMGAVYHAVAHLEGHAQELIYIARLRRGDAYQFKDQY